MASTQDKKLHNEKQKKSVQSIQKPSPFPTKTPSVINYGKVLYMIIYFYKFYLVYQY